MLMLDADVRNANFENTIATMILTNGAKVYGTKFSDNILSKLTAWQRTVLRLKKRIEEYRKTKK